MRLSVRTVIYFYIFICVALLLFNLLYIARSGRVKRRQAKKVQHWENALDCFLDGDSARNSGKRLRQLKKTEELTAFCTAMERREQARPGSAAAFFRQNHAFILELAKEYGKRAAMERAFFAYVIAAFYPVFSRENVLNALYALGYVPSVEHAFILMSQRGWYHDPRLLSDGLSRFRGEKNALASRLWNCRDHLSECFQVGVIRFADSLDGDEFAEEFLRALETEPLPTESRFALVRYFRRHAVPYAEQTLLRLLKGEQEGRQELAIAAAFSLASYPDEEVRRALKEALHSLNWYVRQNAARSLKTLHVTWGEVEGDFAGDRYAIEMMEYMLGGQPPANGERTEQEALAEV